MDSILEDLSWLGLEWSKPVLFQSLRDHHYGAALERLRKQGLVYPCFCTRSDIAAALEAPHGPNARYPGTCRSLPNDPQKLAFAAHSWRLDAARALEITGLPSWTEVDGRVLRSSIAEFDDVILARKDAPAAYHLACVVDDGASEVNLVTRAADLRPSTPIQRLLQMLLGLPEPIYFHHPMVAHSDGRRLAKRDRAPTLEALRAQGMDGQEVAEELLAGKLPLGFIFLEA